MMNTEAKLRLFEGSPIRVSGTHEEPTFNASDVCGILGLSNPRQSLSSLDEAEKALVITETPGGPQEMLFLTESGLYHLTFKSRKETAKRFRRWVTSEVLPEIRRTGAYLNTQKEDPIAQLLRECQIDLVEGLHEKRQAQARIEAAIARKDELISRINDAVPYENRNGAILRNGIAIPLGEFTWAEMSESIRKQGLSISSTKRVMTEWVRDRIITKNGNGNYTMS